METLIGVTVLGLFCFAAELLNWRKLMLPVVVIGLLGLFGWNAMQWGTNEGFYNDMFFVDNFSIAFNGLLLLLGALVILIGVDYYKKDIEHWSDYLSITVFTLVGAILMVGFGNLTMLFIGIEILSISLYILAGSKKWSLESNEAGMKYFLMGSFATGFLLFGIALIFGATGSFEIQKIHAAIATISGPAENMMYAGFLMMLVGLFFKISAAPFHFWAPDVYQGSPYVVTIFMATIAKIAAVAALYRLVTFAFPVALPGMYTIFMVVTIATLCIGNITAAVQDNFKRMLAFSGISHAGYMLMGVMTVDLDKAGYVLYYATGYALASIAAFTIGLIVYKNTRNENISGFKGLMKKQPVLAVAMAIALFSMAGIPPFAGFWGKYFIFTAAISKGFIAVAIVAILNALIGVYYYFKVNVQMMAKDETDAAPFEVSAIQKWIVILCTILIVVLGLFPDLLANLLS